MLSTLKLENFRSHHNLTLELGHTNVILGRNGAGKTNILEAVSMLAFGRSFRQEDKKNLINYESDFARILADKNELILAKNPRFSLKARINKVAKRLPDFIGIIPAVVFSPETVSMITGAPADRRRFLDLVLGANERDYFLALLNFKKIRLQRSSLLERVGEGRADPAELDFWDAEFSKEAKIINRRREELIIFLNEHIDDLYQTIADRKGDSFKLELSRNYEGELGDVLRENRRREIAYGGSIYGPHRDDVVFLLSGRNMANFASRGELKSAILALKIAELKFIERISADRREEREKPLLLLDDIFSEFDLERRERLSQMVLEYQSIITSTERSKISEKIMKQATIINL